MAYTTTLIPGDGIGFDDRIVDAAGMRVVMTWDLGGTAATTEFADAISREVEDGEALTA